MTTKTKKPATKRNPNKGAKLAPKTGQGSSGQIRKTPAVRQDPEPNYEQEIGQAKLFLTSLQEPIYSQHFRFVDNRVMRGSSDVGTELQFGPDTEDKLTYIKALSDLVLKGHEVLRARKRDRTKVDDAVKALIGVLGSPAEGVEGARAHSHAG